MIHKETFGVETGSCSTRIEVISAGVKLSLHTPYSTRGLRNEIQNATGISTAVRPLLGPMIVK